MRSPEKFLDYVASCAAFAVFWLGAQGLFMFAQGIHESDALALALGVVSVGSAIFMWVLRRGIRARATWARRAYETLLWGVASLTVCFVASVLLAPPSSNEEMRDAQELMRILVPATAVLWFAVLGYDLWRVRHRNVRALFVATKAR